MDVRLVGALALTAIFAVGCASPEAQQALSASTPASAPPSPVAVAAHASGTPTGSSTTTCSGFAVSVAVAPGGVHGTPTSKGALLKWLKSSPARGYNQDPTAWHAIESGRRYTDGVARVTVSAIPSPGTGYIVTEGSTCPEG